MVHAVIAILASLSTKEIEMAARRQTFCLW